MQKLANVPSQMYEKVDPHFLNKQVARRHLFLQWKS